MCNSLYHIYEGMKVICIDNENFVNSLSNGRIYVIIACNKKSIIIVDDNGKNVIRHLSRFIGLREYRRQKLERIANV